MKRLSFLLVILTIFGSVSARQTIVSSASAINNTSWAVGDTIVLRKGVCTNQTISLRAFGTQNQPIVLIAESAGDVILNGSSRISISGNYIEIHDLYFKAGNLSGQAVVEFRTSSSNHAQYCRMTNCAIIDYNPLDNTVDSKWVSLYGQTNRVDNCSFENKTNSGTLLVVWLNEGVIPSHTIENNYFGYRNANLDEDGKELNGQEIIRIGTSDVSMQDANCIVQNNLFEKCNGEIERISNKSCGNIYSNNVFYECEGMLTLRHGNNCTVEGNYFIGNEVSSSGGVRVIGADHKVYNNYFENLKGTNYRAALCLVRGKENSELHEYFQVKNALIAFNTFVNCNQAFCVNYNSSSSLTLPPINTVIAHNHVYNTKSSNTNVNLAKTQADLDVVWKNNLMNIGKYTNFTYNSSQVITGKDAKMQQTSSALQIYEPKVGSELSSYTTSEYNNIAIDLRGRVRSNSSKLPGASEINGEITKVAPSKKSTGASFLNDFTSVNEVSDNVRPYTLRINNKQISVESNLSGQLYIYNIVGKQLDTSSLNPISSYEQSLSNGVFIVCFITDKGLSYTEKIII